MKRKYSGSQNQFVGVLGDVSVGYVHGWRHHLSVRISSLSIKYSQDQLDELRSERRSVNIIARDSRAIQKDSRRLGITTKGNPIAMYVCGKQINVKGRLIRIAHLDADKYQFLDDPEALLKGLRKSESRVDLFTFMQIMPDTSPRYAYPMEWDNLAVLPVSTFDHWWNHQIRSLPRNRARQAEKRGVTFREVPFDNDLIEGIWKIYNECPMRQGKPFSHYGKDIETVRKEAGTYLDRSFFIGAFFRDTMIGFAKLTCDQSGRQANLMNILSMAEHKEKAPTNALIAQSVRSCVQRKIPYLVYQSYFYGSKSGDTLTKFKDNNGFQRVDLPRYFIPLTPLGWAAFRLGLHRKLVDYFPEAWAAKLRELRASWYSRKLQSSAERAE